MTRSSNKVFSKLNNKLKKLDGNKHKLCLLTKDSYFTREPKKLSFIDDIKINESPRVKTRGILP